MEMIHLKNKLSSIFKLFLNRKDLDFIQDIPYLITEIN